MTYAPGSALGEGGGGGGNRRAAAVERRVGAAIAGCQTFLVVRILSVLLGVGLLPSRLPTLTFRFDATHALVLPLNGVDRGSVLLLVGVASAVELYLVYRLADRDRLARFMVVLLEFLRDRGDHRGPRPRRRLRPPAPHRRGVCHLPAPAQPGPLGLLLQPPAAHPDRPSPGRHLPRLRSAVPGDAEAPAADRIPDARRRRERAPAAPTGGAAVAASDRARPGPARSRGTVWASGSWPATPTRPAAEPPAPPGAPGHPEAGAGIGP